MTEAAQKSVPSLLGAIGKRVTIRLREPSGGFRDIVGILQSERKLINAKSETITFSPDEIAIWREIKPLPDLAGKGAPYSQRIIELEKLSDLTWPAERVIEYGKWRIRISDGLTMRANSTLPTGSAPHGEPPSDLAEAVKYVTDLYRENGLTPTFTVPLPLYEELDKYLEDNGWKIKVGANYLIRDIGSVDLTCYPEFTVEISDNPSKSWLDIRSDQALEKLMLRHPARYGAIKSGEEIIAVGRIATFGSWAIVARLFVDPAHRGKGLAKILMNHLMASASGDGAAKIALQVDDENGAGMALYQSMGFRTHHKYITRTLDKELIVN
jgi:ribosomal protein S18 acetylase RimI-like enzyme